MKLSTKGRYGLRALLDIALFSEGENVALLHIANRQDISIKYLEQVFSTLRKAQIVNSMKGSQGGYMLAAPPAEITVGSILRALEGDLDIGDEAEQPPESLQGVLQSMLWERINESVNDILDSTTLADLAAEYRRLHESIAPMYYI